MQSTTLTSMGKSKKNSLSIWLMAIRPKTLLVSLGPVILGISLATAWGGHVHAGVALLILSCTLLMQIGANLVNDYQDGVKGIDTPHRLGPVRVTSQKLLSPNTVRRGYQLTFLLAFLLGVPLMQKGGLPIIFIGMSSLLFAYLYTAPFFPLSHCALGEVLAFIFFGPVAVGGTYYLLTHDFNFFVLLAGFIPGFFSSLLMAINNLRDRVSDQKQNKTTVMTLLSETQGRQLAISFLLLATLTAFICTLVSPYPVNASIILLAAFSPLLFGKSWKHLMYGPLDAKFNQLLPVVGKAQIVFILIFSIGLMLPLLQQVPVTK